MRHTRVLLVLAAGAALLAGGTLYGGGLPDGPAVARPAPGELPPPPVEPDVTAVRLLFGLRDSEPQVWEGEIEVTGGSLVRLSGWKLGRGDWVASSAWSLVSAPDAERAQAEREAAEEALEGPEVEDGPPAPDRGAFLKGVVAEIRDAGNAQVRLRIGDRTLGFALAELRPGVRLALLQGQAAAERIPLHRQITTGPTDDDFPAAAIGPDGTVWVAYTAYHRGNPIDMQEVRQGRFDSLVTQGNGDQIRLTAFDGRQWSEPVEVTAPGLDVWRPTVAVDSDGRVWVVWSEGRAGNWDLYGRSYDPRERRLGRVRRLTSGAGAELNAVAAKSGGAIYVAWQGWDRDQFDIWVARLGAEGELRGERVSSSPANDWNPAIAAGPGGQIWIAWDTYDRGNYDVLARPISGGRLGAPVTIAASPRFEARASIAVDGAGRLWVAFEDADENWAKDYGSRWEGKSGVPFYLDRRILVRCVADGRVQETRAPVRAEPIDTVYPQGARLRISMPRLGLDGQGRLWLLYRRHPLRTGQGERWVSFATRYEGDAWSEPVQLPDSVNLLDNRPALAPLRSGELLAVYSSDGRTGGTQSAEDNDLQASILAGTGEPKPPVLTPAEVSGSGPAAGPVHPDEAGDIRRMRSYRVQAGGKTYLLLRGEFHRHTEISSHRDQDGPFEEIWRYGLDVARMDWIGPGDHDNGMGNEYTWWLTQKQIDLYHHAPLFIPMFTYERSVVYPSGHRNVMFARRGIRPLPRLTRGRGGMGQGGMARDLLLFGTPEAGSPDVKNLYAYLKRFDGICSSHTSATNMGTDWRDNDPAVEPVVEIYQGHRQNYEEPNAPKAARDAQDSIGGYQPAGFVWNAFAKGYRLGFQVSSDHVSTHISYAVALAERPTREAILDAFKKRHSYGANDNIVLDVRCGDRLMGDEFESRNPPRLTITVQGTAPIARVDIVRQIDRERPAYVYATEPKRREVRLEWSDTAAKPGALNMYYVRIAQEDGKLAWASPLWIHYRP